MISFGIFFSVEKRIPRRAPHQQKRKRHNDEEYEIA